MSSNSLKNHFEVQITSWQRIERILFFALILTPSFLGYFFVSGPLGDLQRVSGDTFRSTDWIKIFLKEYLFFVQISTFCQRVSPGKMESGKGQKRKFFDFFARASFALQNDL